MAKYLLSFGLVSIFILSYFIVSQPTAETTEIDTLVNAPAQYLASPEVEASVAKVIEAEPIKEQTQVSSEPLTEGLPGDEEIPATEVVMEPLPGEEIHYAMTLGHSGYHDLKGTAKSDIGELVFTANLSPSSEVALDILVKGEKDQTLRADIDLAHFTMELDGGGTVLTQEHKTMMAYTAEHLRQNLIKQYHDEIPYHSLMTVQMLMYWSKSPEGYSHEKREVVSNY